MYMYINQMVYSSIYIYYMCVCHMTGYTCHMTNDAVSVPL